MCENTRLVVFVTVGQTVYVCMIRALTGTLNCLLTTTVLRWLSFCQLLGVGWVGGYQCVADQLRPMLVTCIAHLLLKHGSDM